MKNLLLICLVTFGMNVQAQKCEVFIKVTLFNIKDMQTLFIGHSTSIGQNDIVQNQNVFIYNLEPSQDYMFTFGDEEQDKTFMLHTSNECENVLYVNVDMNKHGSATSFWENGQYIHKYFDDERY